MLSTLDAPLYSPLSTCHCAQTHNTNGQPSYKYKLSHAATAPPAPRGLSWPCVPAPSTVRPLAFGPDASSPLICLRARDNPLAHVDASREIGRPPVRDEPMRVTLLTNLPSPLGSTIRAHRRLLPCAPTSANSPPLVAHLLKTLAWLSHCGSMQQTCSSVCLFLGGPRLPP